MNNIFLARLSHSSEKLISMLYRSIAFAYVFSVSTISK
nr:MAG TPA_asm: hypothetical protein [Caudoviricetes sp.]